MSTTIFSLTREEMEESAAFVYAVTLDHLVEQGKLTQEDAKKLQRDFTPIILTRRSLFHNLREIIFGKKQQGDKDALIYSFVALPAEPKLA